MKKLKIAITMLLVMSFAVSMLAVFPSAKGQNNVTDRPAGAYLKRKSHSDRG